MMRLHKVYCYTTFVAVGDTYLDAMAAWERYAETVKENHGKRPPENACRIVKVAGYHPRWTDRLYWRGIDALAGVDTSTRME